jgi:hypothetical protein
VDRRAEDVPLTDEDPVTIVTCEQLTHQLFKAGRGIDGIPNGP